VTGRMARGARHRPRTLRCSFLRPPSSFLPPPSSLVLAPYSVLSITQVAQWVALQARARKMSEDDFRALAATHQLQADAVFDRVLAFSTNFNTTPTADGTAAAAAAALVASSSSSSTPVSSAPASGGCGEDVAAEEGAEEVGGLGSGGAQWEKELEELVTAANGLSDWFPVRQLRPLSARSTLDQKSPSPEAP